MTARAFRAGVFVTLLAGVSLIWAADTDRSPRIDLNQMSLEVTALQTLQQFQFTYGQMEKIRQCARETMEKGRPRKDAHASQEFQDKLRDLHKALTKAADQDLIELLSEELEDLRYDEKPVLDDEVLLTKEARRHAPELLRLLKTNQYAAFTGLLVDLVDPLDLLAESLSKVRELKGAEWRDKRKQIAAEIGRLVGGVNAAKETKAKKAVVDLLTRARKLSSEEFDDQVEELTQAARDIIGKTSPADVIRNEVEYCLAELLSNTALSAALAARLQL